MSSLDFPPLFRGLVVEDTGSPFRRACLEATKGCDAGLVVYSPDAGNLNAAIVFAPELDLADAMAILPVCAVGFQNALGALAPPELAVHLDWDGGIRVNGAKCGKLQVAASDDDPEVEPDWIVVGLTLSVWPQSDDPGHTPDQTSLYSEGCGEVSTDSLLEAWVRHTLVGINRWSDDGIASLHREWSGLAHGIGEATAQGGKTGTFLGVDEKLGMLIRDENETHLIPLTFLLKGN